MNWKLETQAYSNSDKPDEPLIEDIEDNTEISTEEELEEEEIIEKEPNTTANTTEYFNTLVFLADNNILNLDEDAEYEDSEEGLKQAITDHIVKEKQKVEDSLEEEEKELLEFIRNGGKAKDFLEIKAETDYSDIDLDDDQSKFNLVVEHLTALGYEHNEAIEAAKASYDAGTLDKQAVIAQKKMIEFSAKSTLQKIELLKKSKESKEKEDLRLQEDYKKTVLSTRSLKGFDIKETEAQKLYDYIMKPLDKTGITALQKTNTEENKLAYAWLLMNGFDMNKIKKQLATEATKDIKKSLSAHRDNLVKTKTTNVQQEIDKESKKLNISWNFGKK